MTNTEVENLKKKIDNGEATPEEKLLFIKEIIANIDGMRQDIMTLKKEDNLENVRNDINKL